MTAIPELETGPGADLARLTGSLRSHGLEGCELAFVLGSGLGAFAERVEAARRIPYSELEGMPTSRVAGHAGSLVVGELGGVRVVVQQGRVHLYEGWSVHEVTRAVRAFVELGCRGVVLTNAAGGLRKAWQPGTLMRLVDHVNMQGRALLERAHSGYGRVYDEALGEALDGAARSAGVALERGVYAGLLGPSYETPAEVRMLRGLGADAVGMSTVAEACAARAAGARVAAVSLVTNPAAGLGDAPLSHEEVVEAGRQASGRFCALLEAAVAPLAAVVRG